ncbi:MAG: GatB/YqeY domain-containing protein [Rhodobacteraceae bacterium]|nr:GatB/YqeY domain-containing protein [Paracoccaceae bacterium]MCY4250056.1 GatB/YqeY domain-containing protein [Paracoccaceae bacterium]
MNLRKNIAEGLHQAQIENTKDILPVLRLINTVIVDRDRQAREEGNVEGVSDRIIYEVLVKMLEQKKMNFKSHEEKGEADLANQEMAEIKLIQGLLPRKLTGIETIQAVDRAIKTLEASGVRDKGHVMASLRKNYNWGQMDFHFANSHLVKKLC